jgi:hypothetical protein
LLSCFLRIYRILGSHMDGINHILRSKSSWTFSMSYKPSLWHKSRFLLKYFCSFWYSKLFGAVVSTFAVLLTLLSTILSLLFLQEAIASNKNRIVIKFCILTLFECIAHNDRGFASGGGDRIPSDQPLNLVLKTDLFFYDEHSAGSVALRPLPGLVRLSITLPSAPLAQNRLLTTVFY